MYMGRLDDFKIYDYALSHSEVLNLAGLSSWYQPVLSEADLYQDSSEEIINFRDYIVLIDAWLEEELWP